MLTSTYKRNNSLTIERAVKKAMIKSKELAINKKLTQKVEKPVELSNEEVVTKSPSHILLFRSVQFCKKKIPKIFVSMFSQLIHTLYPDSVSLQSPTLYDI